MLELGPGSDPGVGILLVQAGAQSYVGVARKSVPVHAALGGLPPAVHYEVVPDFQFAGGLGEGQIQAFIIAGWKNVRTSPVHRTNLVGRVHGTFDPSDMDQMTVLLEADRQASGDLSVRCLAMAGAIDLPAPTRGRRLRG